MHTPVVLQMPSLGQSASVEHWKAVCLFSVSMDVMKDIMLVPPHRVAPPKLPVLLLKTAGVAVLAARFQSQ